MHKKLSRVLLALITIILILVITFCVLRSLFPRTHFGIIQKYCNEFDTDTSLVLAIIKAESNFNPNSVSHADAQGIMQLTEDTFKFCNDSLKINGGDIFSPDENIRAGVWYLSYLMKRYEGNTKNALSAYNAGASNVDKWLKDSRYCSDGKTLTNIPFNETARYVAKISRYKIIYDILY